MPHSHLIPAVAIVDSRNLVGQCQDVLGVPFAPTVAGIRAAMRQYGFDVGHVAVATATQIASTKPSARLLKAERDNKQLAAAVRAAADTSVLEGRLVERGKEMSEKLVDVLCAVEILKQAQQIAAGNSNAKAIVVLSEDLDLTPAYPVAEDLGVPVYALANDVVHVRGHRWLLLGQSAARAIIGPTTYGTGHDVRDKMATFLVNNASNPLRFKLRYTDSKTNTAVLVHRSNIIGEIDAGLLPAPADAATGRYDLYPAGAVCADSRGAFPRMLLQPTPCQNMTSIVAGTVTAWTSPTEIVVDVNGTEQRVTTSVGYYLPGTQVLLRVDPGNRLSLIGSQTGGASLPRIADLTEPVAVRVVNVATSASAAVAAIEGTSTRVWLRPTGDCAYDPAWSAGDRLNAIIVEDRSSNSPAGGPTYVAHAISSLL